jgi:hypothetical protein
MHPVTLIEVVARSIKPRQFKQSDFSSDRYIVHSGASALPDGLVSSLRWREQMLTRMFSAIPADSRLVMGSIVALALLATSVPLEPANAGGVDVTNCIRSSVDFSCVERWGWTGDQPTPSRHDPQEEAESAARERQWAARCHPVVKQDQYGVGRYQYAAPGCEFGRFQD